MKSRLAWTHRDCNFTIPIALNTNAPAKAARCGFVFEQSLKTVFHLVPPHFFGAFSPIFLLIFALSV